MFEKLANGWELMKASGRVLRQDTELLVFPLISGIACLFVMASFAIPMFFTGAFNIGPDQVRDATNNPLAYVVLFAFYFCNYFVIVFFNSALVACAILRFNGRNPTLSDGFQAAVSRLPQIIAWSLVSATVGVLLKVIESRSEKIGQIVAGLIGIGWGIATFFVVPVIVVEQAGPIDAIRRSTSILRKAWGEAFVGNQGIGLFIFLFGVAACIPAIVGVFTGHAVGIGIGIAVSAVLLIGLSIVSAALHTILLGALYVFAADGRIPNEFNSDVLSRAFAPRRS